MLSNCFSLSQRTFGGYCFNLTEHESSSKSRWAIGKNMTQIFFDIQAVPRDPLFCAGLSFKNQNAPWGTCWLLPGCPHNPLYFSLYEKWKPSLDASNNWPRLCTRITPACQELAHNSRHWNRASREGMKTPAKGSCIGARKELVKTFENCIIDTKERQSNKDSWTVFRCIPKWAWYVTQLQAK